MKALLRFARLVDVINEWVGHGVYWLVLVAVLISAGNAIMRKAFHMSSNAFLEIQWYLFAAVFLLAAGYTLLRNEHVRIDVVSSRLSQKAQIVIDIVGTLLFLLPLCGLVLYYGWPYFMLSFQSQEWSSNPGGLIIWPVKLLMPVGFALLFLQALAQLVKLFGALTGDVDPASLIKSHGHGAADVEVEEHQLMMSDSDNNDKR